jgi:hypothetical protein
MIEIIVTNDELKGIQNQDEYVKNKLRKAGVPVTGFFSFKSQVKKGQLTKYTLTDEIVKFVWSD